jgi:hypothetical protein
MDIVQTFWGALVRLEENLHVHSLTSYPSQWTKYSKHSQKTYEFDIFFILNFCLGHPFLLLEVVKYVS